MPTKNALLLALLSAVSIAPAFAQIAVPGITLPAPAAAAAAAAPAVLAPVKPGTVTLREAAQSEVEGNAAATSTPQQSTAQHKESKQAPEHAQTAMPLASAVQLPAGAAPSSVLPPQVTPLPMPFPAPVGFGVPKSIPDVTLVRISTTNGVQRATLYVKGVTRAGLTVGDKVLKQVLSEFRDDGVCLDTSLHKPKCATFVAFSYQ